MSKIIKIANEYFAKILKDDRFVSADAINVSCLKVADILKREEIIFRIDFENFDVSEYKRVLRKLLKIRNTIKITKKKLGKNENDKRIIAYILNYNENNKNHHDFILAINAIFHNTRYERYNYIYDTVCDYLDGFFYGKNLCDFKDTKCGEKRNTSSLVGCCHHYKYKILGPLSKFVLCEHLNQETHSCDAKCLSCKLFTCDYLEKKGVKFRIKDILLLDVFFNPIQKYFIKYMVYTPKEKILKRLVRL